MVDLQNKEHWQRLLTVAPGFRSQFRKDALIQAFRSVREYVLHASLTQVQGEAKFGPQYDVK